MALRAEAVAGLESSSRARRLRRLRSGDALFRIVTRAAALAVLAVLAGVIVALVAGALPALKTFGLDFLISQRWNPVTEQFGALAPISPPSPR
jgi:phosphate transport system permease protein